IDGAIGRTIRAAQRSRRRIYDVWVLSDHGQEHTVPYIERHGRPVGDAVSEVFRSHGIEPGDARELAHGIERIRALRRHLVGIVAPDLDYARERWEPGTMVVTAQGPLGHVYAPRPLE